MPAPRNVIIVGAGGHGKVLADLVEASGGQVLGFLDDNPEKRFWYRYPVLGTAAEWSRWAERAQFLLAIGDNHLRKVFADRMDVCWYTAVHPTARVSASAKIGAGTVVLEQAVVHADSSVGEHCILNTGAIVEHDNRLGSYVHLSPRATLCGTVTVGDYTHMGAGSVVRNNLTICQDVIVGAGAVVVRPITEPGTYLGVPARSVQP